MTLTIKSATASDANALSAFGARIFYETYIAGHAQDVVVAHVAGAFSPAQQARELADPTITTILGLDDSGALIGFAQWRFGPVPSCVVDQEPAELWRFYVGREFHGLGIAQRLLNHTLENAYEAGVEAMWVGVWAPNARALAFYRKHGFVEVGTHPYVMVNEVQDDIVLVHKRRSPIAD
jgi:ribosomal protein S18 acetylase RimI-like enzyme